MRGWFGAMMFVAGGVAGAGIYGLAERSPSPRFQLTLPAKASAPEKPRPCDEVYVYSTDANFRATLADIRRCLFEGAAR